MYNFVCIFVYFAQGLAYVLSSGSNYMVLQQGSLYYTCDGPNVFRILTQLYFCFTAWDEFGIKHGSSIPGTTGICAITSAGISMSYTIFNHQLYSFFY